jgi:hypothetical protein
MIPDCGKQFQNGKIKRIMEGRLLLWRSLSLREGNSQEPYG